MRLIKIADHKGNTTRSNVKRRFDSQIYNGIVSTTNEFDLLYLSLSRPKEKRIKLIHPNTINRSIHHLSYNVDMAGSPKKASPKKASPVKGGKALKSSPKKAATPSKKSLFSRGNLFKFINILCFSSILVLYGFIVPNLWHFTNL